MKNCGTCGKEYEDNLTVCPHCGAAEEVVAQQEAPQQTYAQAGAQQAQAGSVDNGGFGWGLLGFLIPLVGLILYLVWKDEKPNTAKAAGKGALISVIIGVVMYVLVIILGVAGAFLGSTM